MLQATDSTPWIAYHKPKPGARLRLLCFPYAGGGALAYRSWNDQMPAEIEVLPVQLPGRERRLREPPIKRMEPLIEALVPALTPLLDRPFAFFGHSMGGAISYELAHRLRSEHGLAPAHLLVSARRAPQLPPDPKQYYTLPDQELCDELRKINGTPTEVLDNPELMALMLPLLRADFELNDTYHFQQPDYEPLECPVTGFGGLEDGEVEREEIEAWRELTRGAFKLRMFPGDHFYLHQHGSALVAAVSEALLRR